MPNSRKRSSLTAFASSPSAPDTSSPLSPVKPVKRHKKKKSVTWASESSIAKIKQYALLDPPAVVSGAIASSGSISSSKPVLRDAFASTIPWKQPLAIDLSNIKAFTRGEQSKEKEVQQQREADSFVAYYHENNVPPNPGDAPDEPDYDQTTVPQIIFKV